MKGIQHVWSALIIKRDSPIPAYYQIKEFIKELVKEAKVAPDTQIPSERELCTLYEVSRMTARQALSELVKEGYLYREKGKGTFVAPPKMTQPMFTLVSFSENMHQRGMVAQGRTLRREILYETPEDIRENLELLAEDNALIFERLRLANGIPMVVERSYFSCSRYGFLIKADLDNHSLFHLLEKNANTIPVSSRETIESGLADEFLARQLQVEKGAPILLVTGISYTREKQPIEYVESFYRGDRFKLFVEMKKE